MIKLGEIITSEQYFNLLKQVESEIALNGIESTEDLILNFESVKHVEFCGIANLFAINSLFKKTSSGRIIVKSANDDFIDFLKGIGIFALTHSVDTTDISIECLEQGEGA